MVQVPSDVDARAVETLAARAQVRVPALTDALVRTIQDQNPGYRTTNVVPLEDLRQSCHDNITRVLQLIAAPADADDERYDAARATGRSRAEQRLPLDDVLRSFRLGGRLVWEALIDQASADSSIETATLLGVATRVWEVVDATSAQVAAAYHEAERHLLRADEQRRAALWEGLLHGRAKDMAFAYEAARVIGVPAEGSYAVVVIDTGAGDTGSAARYGRRLAADRIESAWQARASTLVGLLVLREPRLGPILSLLRETITAPAGLSLVVRGLADVDLAYRQAVLVLRTVAPGRIEVAALAERLPEALLLNSPELAEQLVRLWLCDLLALPAAERALLLATLETWVATGGSISRTAESARCHRNTVINRLARVHAVTGHDFTDPALHIELALALRARRLLDRSRE